MLLTHGLNSVTLWLQAFPFVTRLLEWCWTGVDPSLAHGVEFGTFPMLPSEQIRHIRGVIVRKAVGKGDTKWKRYLALTKRKLPYEYCLDEFGYSSEEEDECEIKDEDETESEDESEFESAFDGEEEAASADTKKTPLAPEEEKLEKSKVYLDKECKMCK